MEQLNGPQEIIIGDFTDGLEHGCKVASLSYEVANEMGLATEECDDIRMAGFLHDIGKIRLSRYLYGRNKAGLDVEEIQYMRMHAELSYEIVKENGFNSNTCNIVLHHHENFDGSGYPSNLKGDDIPLGARVLRVADAFIALVSDRPYRAAFDTESAVEIMIEDIKNYDMEVFIAFQRVINTTDIDSIIGNHIFGESGTLDMSIFEEMR